MIFVLAHQIKQPYFHLRSTRAFVAFQSPYLNCIPKSQQRRQTNPTPSAFNLSETVLGNHRVFSTQTKRQQMTDLDPKPSQTVLAKLDNHTQYLSAGIPSASSLSKDPFLQFQEWFSTAQKQMKEPEAFSLSTVLLPQGIPSTRIVLLKKFDQKGFVFYTNYESRKGRELFPQGVTGHEVKVIQGGYASMAFYWPNLFQSVRIVGRVETVTQEETKEYYSGRPIGSRVGAWASAQSTVLTSGQREELEKRVKDVEQRFGVTQETKEADLPVPPFWGGVRIVPMEVEFWMGRESRLHDRFRYTRKEGGASTEWTVDRLSP